MSEQRTESQDQGSATFNKEQIELIGTVLDLRLKAVVAEMRLATKEEGEKVRAAMDTAIKDTRTAMDTAIKDTRAAMDTAIKDTRTEMKGEVRDQIQAQSKHFYWVISGLVAIWLAAATLAVNKWPQATPVAPAAPVAQVAPVTPAEPPELNEPPEPNEPPELSQP